MAVTLVSVTVVAIGLEPATNLVCDDAGNRAATLAEELEAEAAKGLEAETGTEWLSTGAVTDILNFRMVLSLCLLLSVTVTVTVATPADVLAGMNVSNAVFAGLVY